MNKNYNNYNRDITIREITIDELHDGMYIQSFGNVSYVYHIKIIDGKKCHGASHKIIRDSGVNVPPYLQPMENIIYNRHRNLSDYGYCETTWTAQLNPRDIRHKKLNELIDDDKV